MLTKDQINTMPSINIAKCSKIDYPTKKLALEDIKLIYIQQRYRSKKHSVSKKTGKKLIPYLCPRCGLWHLTSNINYRKRLKSNSK